MPFFNYIIFFSLALPFFFTISSSTQFTIDTDKQALLAIKSNFLSIDPSTTPLSTWLNDQSSPCNWTGVTCSLSHRRVVELNLSGMGLRGFISPFIGNFSFLKSLNLQNNQLSGPIPDQIGNLLRLNTLNISFNLIEGEIPQNLSRCSELVDLDLMQNQISGKIPDDLSRLSKLEHLNLARNHFSGPIPLSITNISSLVYLNLGTNSLIEGIPSEIENLRNLQILDLTINNLNGTVPPSLYNMSTMIYIALASNNLLGNLPTNIGFSLPNLLGFNFCFNKFTGPIPPSLHNLTRIRTLRMASMFLDGSVPPGLENLRDLEMYNIGFNRIVSKGDDGLSFLTSLTNATRLTFLAIDRNLLEGRIPESIGNLSKVLSKLYMGGNRFYGRIPSSVGKLSGLTLLNISYNSISGGIPPEIGMLTNLQELDLSGNRLSGSIPVSLGNLEKLNKIFLSRNDLVGSVPAEFGKFKDLITLDLSRNTLNGSIPKEILSLPSLSTLLNLSKNSFSGSLDEDIGKLDNIVAIDLSDNLLSGNIPSLISRCNSLEKLLLANNKFSGSIPSSLKELKGLEILDLSSNMLSGTIPIELKNLQALKLLNLSFNNLEGPIPYGFVNTSLIDLRGNPKLGLKNNVGSRRRTKLILISTLIVVPILLTVCISVLWVICMRRNGVKDKVFEVFSESFKGKHMMVSYNDIRMATENFDEKNMIGRGSFGAVYIGRIGGEGSPFVAIKVIDMDRAGSMKTFVAECAALKNIRHRNLVKLITACSSTDFKNRDFVALVYELMSNGSLEDWITGKRKHINGDGPSIVERLRMAIDVATAINYLHNECEGQVLHCDLKPNNILLDEEMVAKVADFGLSKLKVCDDSRHSISLSNTFDLRGSIGYIPPEYGMGHKPGAAGDVYSFGITLLELFTGRGPTHESFVGGMSLKKWVEKALESNGVDEVVVDSSVVMNMGKSCSEKGECFVSVEQEWKCLNEVLEVGIQCTFDSFEARLSIKEVLFKLRNIMTQTFINM